MSPRAMVAVTAALGALACVLVGCGTAEERPPTHAGPNAIGWRRVAVVEFVDRTAHSGTAEGFTRALRDRLAERVAGTDVVVVPSDVMGPGLDPFEAGAISVDALVRARTTYMADALVIGAVYAHNPYYPPSVHVSVKVLDTASAAVLFELTQEWDSGREDVREAIDAYYRQNIGSDDCRFGPDLFLISPRYFLGFVAGTVADRIVAAL